MGAVVLWLLLGKRADLDAAGRQLGHVDPLWLAAAIAAEGLWMWMFSYLQHRILRLGGTVIALPSLLALSLANGALATSVPGEPLVSGAYRYRYYRRRGTPGAVAGWTVFTMLVAQSIGMALLVLLGVAVAAAGAALAGAATIGNAGTAIAGVIIVGAAIAVLARRDLLLRLAGGLVAGVRRITGYPRGSLAERLSAALARMREIPLRPRATAGLVVIGTGLWCCDFACLLCAFGAVRAPVPWYGVLLAYGSSEVIGSLPFVPGGLGIVEGSLAVILTAYGAGRVSAVSAALVYRLVTYWLVIAVGWSSFGLLAFRESRQRGAVDS